MKNANLSRLGGFTLIELLVVVLIIGILAAMAMPQYFKAVERTRMTEAVTLMDSIVKAQRRKYMQTNHYAREFEGLDVSPKGASGHTYFPKGEDRNGFGVYLMNDFGVVAGTHCAVGDCSRYSYSLTRYYKSDNITCFGGNEASRELCADFCGIDTPVEQCCDNGTSGNCPDNA